MGTLRLAIIGLIVLVSIAGILPSISNISKSSSIDSEFSTVLCVRSICINDPTYNHCSIVEPVISKLYIVREHGSDGNKKIMIELSDSKC